VEVIWRRKLSEVKLVRKRVVAASLVFSFSIVLLGQTTKPTAAIPDASSCHRFVQGFYDWYAPVAAAATERMTVSLRQRQGSFDPTLWQMLVADEEAQSQANEIVGLDFDPILNSQDPSSKFTVNSASVKSSRCNATVVGINDGIEEEHVMPELILSNGRWVLVNFHYQSEVAGKLRNSGDLVQALKDWARERARLIKEKSE
jgi:Protein of unknown function (DUF3828)